mgnify:CR=1 FL=1
MTLKFDLLSPKSIRVICRSWPTSLSTFMILGPSVSSYNPEMKLMFRAPVTLTYDLMYPKSIWVIYRSWPTSLSSFMILGLSVLQLSSGNDFSVSGPCDIDLWPYQPKINRGLLPVMTNFPINFHDPRPKRSPVIIRKWFYCFGPLWPWPLIFWAQNQ